MNASLFNYLHPLPNFTRRRMIVWLRLTNTIMSCCLVCTISCIQLVVWTIAISTGDQRRGMCVCVCVWCVCGGVYVCVWWCVCVCGCVYGVRSLSFRIHSLNYIKRQREAERVARENQVRYSNEWSWTTSEHCKLCCRLF